ncbi:vWA domain-containing protein [Nannocystis bainbridge]|uniref:VWA domain-containing protein n=1 Tax=Nannocystis bainbridge TaxID=2995303 RepID=A0ABT5E553_9BACT|nr:vWA domain-containing protein [Nannocystis bainbridge]MDC0719881.1 VWA domain-containing protein [Nannocystis bainbridge]
MSRVTSLSRFSLTAGAALALTACLEHPIKKVLYDKSSEAQENVAIAINKDVDILFVIDNSGSMADEQALLAKNFAAFINVLEAEDVNANYRIGITTTDSGNPRCPAAQTTPEGGKLVLSSCLGRVDLGDFSFDMDDYAYACTDVCNLTDDQLQIKPTETAYSNGEKAPRNWIERIETVTNLPDDVTTVQAFQCFGPQGVSGCGFEQHLESMYRALALAGQESSGSNYGFIRDTAILSIVFITDEVDCSHNDKFKEIFTTNKQFWEDPDRPDATSAVCFNAGVKCDGAGPTFARCESANYGIDGSVDVADADAVLQPLSKYINFVQNLETQKQTFDLNQEVLVALIAGVPPGYEDGDKDIVYEDDPDPDQQDLFGIGKGCTLPNMMDPDAPQTALPPVREREFAEAFQVGDDRNLFSICQDDYSGALKAIANKIRDQIKPACMTKCVKDVDPSDAILQPNCQIFEDNLAAMTRNEIQPCEEVAGEWIAPAGETACFAELIDPGTETPSEIDNMSEECVLEGYNLEFLLIRTGAAAAGTTISAACELSPNPGNDCPML